jgi:hypothetical protein
MHRTIKVGAALLAALVATAAIALAAPQEGTFTGDSDDAEPVTIKVGTAQGQKVVKLFKVDQGIDCGVTKYSHKTDPDIMPAKIEDNKFKIVDKLAPGVVAFKVKGSFPTAAGDVISGSYSQIACDGETDTYVVYLEV